MKYCRVLSKRKCEMRVSQNPGHHTCSDPAGRWAVRERKRLGLCAELFWGRFRFRLESRFIELSDGRKRGRVMCCRRFSRLGAL